MLLSTDALSTHQRYQSWNNHHYGNTIEFTSAPVDAAIIAVTATNLAVGTVDACRFDLYCGCVGLRTHKCGLCAQLEGRCCAIPGSMHWQDIEFD